MTRELSATSDKMCSDAALQQVFSDAAGDPANAIHVIDAFLEEFPEDHRLHFLKGSLLVGLKRFIGAHQAMSRAVVLAPEFHIARFQLGFFELTSGEAASAIETWKPLRSLPDRHYLRLFAGGLEHLASDRFAQCIADLRAGIAANSENLPLNADMELIIDKCLNLDVSTRAEAQADDGVVSATSLLLGINGLGKIEGQA